MAFHLLEVFVDHALYLLDLDACLREGVYLARNYETNVRDKKIGDAMVSRVAGPAKFNKKHAGTGAEL